MILCLDYGARYIGLAITDPDEKIALRHSVIDQKQREAFDVLKNITESEKITTMLVGLPVSLSGNPSQQTHATVSFIKTLRQSLPTTITLKTIDEMLTSHEAQQHIKAEGGKPEEAHAEAARIMLEEYLRGRE